MSVRENNIGTVGGDAWYVAVAWDDSATPIITETVMTGRMASEAAKWIWDHTSGDNIKLSSNELWLGSNNAVALHQLGNNAELYVWGGSGYLQITDRSDDPDDVLARIGKNMQLYDNPSCCMVGNGTVPATGYTLATTVSTAHPSPSANTAAWYSIDKNSITVPYAVDENDNVAPQVPWKQSTTLGAAATTFAADAPMIELTGDAGANTIATITGERAYAGSRIVLLFVDALITITDDDTHTANTIDLWAAFTSADDKTLELIHDGTSWYEVARNEGVGGGAEGGVRHELIYEVPSMQTLETNYAPQEKITGTNVSKMVAAFDDTTEEYRNQKFACPGNLDTSGTVNFSAWVMAKTAAASKNVELRFGHSARADGEDYDAAYSNVDSGDKAIAATQDNMTLIEWSETVSNLGWAAKDVIYFRISRIAPSANNLADDMYWDLFEIDIPLS